MLIESQDKQVIIDTNCYALRITKATTLGEYVIKADNGKHKLFLGQYRNKKEALAQFKKLKFTRELICLD